jgi:hypothetical protein
MDAVTLLTLISLVASIVGAILAIVAIVLSLVLFLASHKSNLAMLSFLGDIKSSTKKTESSQEGTIKELVGAVAQRSSTKTVEEERTVLAEVEQLIAQETGFSDDAARKRLGKKVSKALSSSFSALSARLSEIPQSAADAVGARSTAAQDIGAHPGFYRVARWMTQNEGKYSFYGVKFLRETIFKADPASQAALQDAIERGMLILDSVENPANPEWKTTACKLNLSHPITREVLRSLGRADS